MATKTVETRKIKPSEVLSLLKKGYTRYEKDNTGVGSVQTHYGLKRCEVIALFQDSRLKGRKTVARANFILEEDEEEASGITDRGEIVDLKSSEKDDIFI